MLTLGDGKTYSTKEKKNIEPFAVLKKGIALLLTGTAGDKKPVFSIEKYSCHCVAEQRYLKC